MCKPRRDYKRRRLADARRQPHICEVIDTFHPAVAAWFAAHFPAATAAQARAWPAIQAGEHTLVAAPTGSGKTLTGFLAAIDALVREALAHGGELPDATQVIYVSPLKALSNDIQINLDAPLAGIRAELARLGLPEVTIRTAVRTGDTPAAARLAMRKRPPQILVTTPESLYILLGSASGRVMLGTARTVIVDEIHAVAASKRGAHLTLSLARLDALCGRRLQRIGLSATQKPIEAVADFLVGAGTACTVIDAGHSRPRDLALVVPPVPLEAVMSHDSWATVYHQLATLAQHHRTTLVFVNTRRMAERVARQLSERLGKDQVMAHHGSLAKEQRLDAEQRLKRGALRVLVATASLELGIDIGDVDLVCQLGSPRSIAAFLQRAGRAGHSVTGTPKARLFPATRDDLVECAALLDCVRRGELDALIMPTQPLDVLAQQIVAEVACADWDEDALYALVRRAYPYRALARTDFDAVVRMLSEGYSTRLGERGAYVHRDAVQRQLRARRGARLTAITSGGAIPDNADYAVLMEPQAIVVGSVHEDFAVESMAGDIFQLGNTSYRILRVEPGRVRVEDAHGVPPSIPFWLGEAPGRSVELSAGVSRLRAEFTAQLERGGADAALRWARESLGLDQAAAQQLVDYLATAHRALGVLPTQQQIVLERFFDASGATQLVIHAPFGSRISRAWGLALRKRFCRQFNFELQAAATEDAIVLSLSTSHSFALEEVARYLHSATAEQVLTQALLDAPLFGARWRWNATTALALPRFTGGKKTAPQLQRMKSEDLLATIFPDQVACLENIAGDREIPTHPLVAQTLHDCLREAMDLDGLLNVLRGIESGAITVTACDLTAPSPLAGEVLTAAPYAFLDDAPLEERRTQAAGRAVNLSDLKPGQLDPAAIDAVRTEAWPQVRSVDEMHEALSGLGFVGADEVAANGWEAFVGELAASARATRILLPVDNFSASVDAADREKLAPLPRTASSLGEEGRGEGEAFTRQTLWTCAEKLTLWQALHPAATIEPTINVPPDHAHSWPREDALRELVRSRLLGLGPITATTLAHSLCVSVDDVTSALLALQSEGHVILGRFTPGAVDEEACERHLLARIHRYTLGRRRREIEPVSRRDLMRFLLEWQHLTPSSKQRGADALPGVLAQLEGYEAAAGAWEAEILPARLDGYEKSWLDNLCRSGRVSWSRLRAGGGGGPVRATPIVLLPRTYMDVWTSIAQSAASEPSPLSSRAQAVADALTQRGALFFDELMQHARLLRTELEDALGELVAAGRISADSFAGLRALLKPAAKRQSNRSRRMQRAGFGGIEDAGRWALVRAVQVDGTRDDDAACQDDPARKRQDTTSEAAIEHIAWTLLRRYGVMCFKLLEREAAWLPSWRDLLRVYRRLEARGEIRGGRFVDGMVGEQFALPEAIPALRAIQRRENDGEQVVLSGCDPLNLVGTVLVGERVPAVIGSRILFEDGVAVAAKIAGKVQWLVESDAERQQRWRVALSTQGPASRAWTQDAPATSAIPL